MLANEAREKCLRGWCTKQWFWENAQVVSAGDVETGKHNL